MDSSQYNKYKKYIVAPKELREVKLLYHALDALHASGASVVYSVDDLEVQMYASYPNMREPEREAIDHLLNQLRKVEVKDEILWNLLSQNETRQLARDMALCAFYVSL